MLACEGLPARIHLAGAAGVGMSALAQALRDAGCRVSASDRYRDQGRDLPVLRQLVAAGVSWFPQDGSGLRAGAEALVISTAVEEDNPERRVAAELNLPVIHRADMLARLACGKSLAAVAGTCGKTTVTGMTGWLLEQAGMDPTVVNGGALSAWMAQDRVGSVRSGRSDLWVVEADESDRSLLVFDPAWAVITNCSVDHFGLGETLDLFHRFLGRVRSGVVLGAQAARLLSPLPAHLDVCAAVPEDDFTQGPDGAWCFRFEGRAYRVPMPGRHNAENALAAVALAHRLGADPKAVVDALSRFQGVHRRLECVGRREGIAVYDDYAHNPAKLQAAWSAVAERHPRILGVWRPHGFGPLASMLRELEEAFVAACRPQDRLFLLPVYYAGGTTTARVSSADLVERLALRGVRAERAVDFGALETRLQAEAREHDAVLIMGARDPDLPLFARSFARGAAWSAAPQVRQGSASTSR